VNLDFLANDAERSLAIEAKELHFAGLSRGACVDEVARSPDLLVRPSVARSLGRCLARVVRLFTHPTHAQTTHTYNHAHTFTRTHPIQDHHPSTHALADAHTWPAVMLTALDMMAWAMPV
jgi:hypothetical protein